MMLKLTRNQLKQIKPLLDQVKAEADAGRTGGMLVAQLCHPNRGDLQVGFIPKKHATKFYRVAKKSADGLLTNSAKGSE
jgi:hypothetical protein